MIQSFLVFTLTSLLNLLNNFSGLSVRMIDKLKAYLTTVDSAKWQDFQTSSLRKVINWDADTVIEELHNVFDGITEFIGRQFSTGPVNFFLQTVAMLTNKNVFIF